MLSRAIRTFALTVAVGALFAAPASAAPFLNGEFEIPGGFGTNNKIAAGPDGNMWLTLDDAEDDVAKITPTGAVEEFDLGPEVTSPTGITAGPDNNLWVVESDGVVKFSPADPPGTADPTDVVQIAAVYSITTGPDKNLWVATAEFLVRIDPTDPSKQQAFPVNELSPRDIDAAGSGLVIADAGGKPKVVIANTQGVVTAEHPLEGASQGVAGGPDGQVGFSQTGSDPREVGVFTPPGPALITKFPGGDPFGVAFGADGAYWSADSNADGVIRFTTDNQTSILAGFPKELGPRQIAAGPGNTLWVTLEDFENKMVPEKVGRVSGVNPPPLPPQTAKEPQTKIGKGPKSKVTTRKKTAKVTFKFSSPDAGAKFECALTKVKKQKKGKKAPKPKFSGCKSPKTYKVKPGKYRFEVRAVLAGVVDPSPAKKTFTVVRKAPKKRS